MQKVGEFLFLAIWLALLVGGFIAAGWQFFSKFEKFKASRKCPLCQSSWAREDLREELVGMFKKRFRPKIQVGRGAGEEIALHGKYILHHRCKHCGHEWTSTETRKM